MTDSIPEEIVLTVKLCPHDVKMGRSKASIAPRITDILKPAWWNRALFGKAGARDPAVKVLSIETKNEADVARLFEIEGLAPVFLKPTPVKETEQPADVVGLSESERHLTPIQRRVLLTISRGKPLFRDKRSKKYTFSKAMRGVKASEGWVKTATATALLRKGLIAVGNHEAPLFVPFGLTPKGRELAKIQEERHGAKTETF